MENFEVVEPDVARAPKLPKLPTVPRQKVDEEEEQIADKETGLVAEEEEEEPVVEYESVLGDLGIDVSNPYAGLGKIKMTKSNCILVAVFSVVVLAWFAVVMTSLAFASRSFYGRNDERFRLSLGFFILSIFFPPFCTVPIALNAD